MNEYVESQMRCVKFPIGTVVTINGIPFQLTQETYLATHEKNVKLSQDQEITSE